MKSSLEKLVAKTVKQARRILEETPYEERPPIMALIKALAPFEPVQDDPVERDKAEIRSIFSNTAEIPRDRKYTREYILIYYRAHAKEPLSAKSFWHLFRQIYPIRDVQMWKDRHVRGIQFLYQPAKTNKEN